MCSRTRFSVNVHLQNAPKYSAPSWNRPTIRKKNSSTLKFAPLKIGAKVVNIKLFNIVYCNQFGKWFTHCFTFPSYFWFRCKHTRRQASSLRFTPFCATSKVPFDSSLLWKSFWVQMLRNSPLLILVTLDHLCLQKCRFVSNRNCFKATIYSCTIDVCGTLQYLKST